MMAKGVALTLATAFFDGARFLLGFSSASGSVSSSAAALAGA